VCFHDDDNVVVDASWFLCFVLCMLWVWCRCSVSVMVDRVMYDANLVNISLEEAPFMPPRYSQVVDGTWDGGREWIVSTTSNRHNVVALCQLVFFLSFFFLFFFLLFVWSLLCPTTSPVMYCIVLYCRSTPTISLCVEWEL